MGTLYLGVYSWSASRSQEGHREYQVSLRVRSDDVNDGPQTIAATAGLPITGSIWSLGNDLDPWAFCEPTYRVRSLQDGEPGNHWIVDRVFSTRPRKRCNDVEIEDPLMEPPKISGSFAKYVKEAWYDKDDKPLRYSSFERITGAAAEFDDSRPTVRIEQNLLNLQLATISELRDHVNSGTMWGLDPRCIKLGAISWSVQYCGQCQPYYARSLEFEINFDTWDREVPDGDRKLLDGSWNDDGPPWTYTPHPACDATDPMDWVQALDPKENPMHVQLSASTPGAPADSEDDVNKITIEYYKEADFIGTLGVPAFL